MTVEQRAWIDAASYEDLLRRWRESPVGDLFFVGDTGDYYRNAMKRKHDEAGPEACVAASKRIDRVAR